MLGIILRQLKFKLKLWWLKYVSPFKGTASADIRQLAFQYGMDRRRHPRVSFPKNFSFFELPYFEYKGVRFDIVDLSIGGVCLFDPRDEFSMSMGSEGEITWVSQQSREKVPLGLVGMTYQKKHLEFQKISPELSLEIEAFLQAGIWGQQMRRSVLSSHNHLETALMELWIGVQGTNLSFHSDPHFVASLEGPHFCVHFFKGSLPVYSKQGPEKGRSLQKEERIKLLFFIYNMPLLSPRIKNLLEDWENSEAALEERAG